MVKGDKEPRTREVVKPLDEDAYAYLGQIYAIVKGMNKDKTMFRAEGIALIRLSRKLFTWYLTKKEDQP
jgi:hypothetical protein